MSRKYSQEHQWIQTNDADGIVGITQHAQNTLGDIVFVELPKIGNIFMQGEVVCVVESVKTAADVFMPVSGEITEVNIALIEDPSLVNSDPMGAGWFFKVKLADKAQLDSLMDETSYNKLID